MAGQVGLDCKFYRNTGTYGTPTWLEIPIVQEATLGLDKAKADASVRTARYKQNLPTLKSAPIELKILADVADTNYDALRDAFMNDTVLDVAMANGAIATNGTEYFRADYVCFGFKRAEPLLEAATVDVALDLVYSAHAPGFTNVGT